MDKYLIIKEINEKLLQIEEIIKNDSDLSNDIILETYDNVLIEFDQIKDNI